MANKKITSLTELTATPASGDMVPLVDVDDTTGASTGTTKRVSVDNLISEIAVADMTASAVVLESEGIGSNDNDTSFPTSAAVKDYVDTNVTAQDLDFQGDSGGALAIDLDSETLTLAGGTGIDTVGAANTVTASIDSTVATLTGSQTLANKTLTSPVIDTGVSGTAVLDDDTFGTASSTTVATSESIKAYVDTQILTEDTFAELNDTNISTPAAGHIAIYDGTDSWDNQAISGDVNIAADGTATIQANSVALATDTTGDFVGGVTAGTGLTSTGATTGENISHTLSVDASQTQITAVGTIATGTWQGTDVGVAHGGTGASTASAARTALGVDAAGTDNSTDVTLATVSANYLSLSGQEVTAGTIPVSLGGTGSTAASAARTALGVVNNATHTGEVTGATELIIAADVVDEANLLVGGTLTDNYVLTADTGATGGMKWAASVGSGHDIVEESGSALATRTKLTFIGELVEAVDNAADDSTDLFVNAKTAWLYG